ncbi:hypothetical protein TrRE_jg10871 [Triparma retinervis]|uniref:phosphopyruvate hydratase n=1 Tax=Triparma retinervis TaxID=2557542 RepID=A0A9W7AJW8_9STRA|nr:hypothetical protein TrRE_jg10871 [Triparma retinervis]
MPAVPLINELVKSRPEDPFLDLSQSVESKSPIANQIVRVNAREIMGSDGLPALEVEVETLRGTVRSIVAGVGPYDGDEERYGGKGVKDAVQVVLTVLGDKLVGKDPRRQDVIDEILTDDPTYPTNAVLGLSTCACKAGAKFNEMEVYEHVAALGNISDPRIPMPWFNLFNGGLQGNNEHHIESISFSVPGAATVADAVMEASKIYQSFPLSLTKLMTPPKAPNNGKIGGYSPQCEAMNDVLEAIKLTLIDLELTEKVNLSINMNSGVYSCQIETEEGDEEIAYQYDLTHFAPEDAVKDLKSSGELLDEYFELMVAYPIVSIEDGFDKKDSASLIELREKVDAEVTRIAEAGDEPNPFPENLGGSDGVVAQLIGNKTMSTQEDLVRAEEKQTFNSCAMSLEKAKTVSNFIALCAKADSLGMPVLAVDEAEQSDSFLAHMAVGLRCSQLRAGGLLGGHAGKYNELLRLEEGDEEVPGVANIGEAWRK